MLRLALAGDVMLGRLVDRYVLADPTVDPAYVWGDVLPLLQQADLRLVNLECVIATRGKPWVPKAFHFRAGPRAIDALRSARIDFVSLANNHVLDFGHEALAECLVLLRNAGVASAGAGLKLADAAAPAMIRAGALTVAVVAMADGEPRWEAAEDRSGINRIEYDQGGLSDADRARVADALTQARAGADVVVVSAHVGPNWGSPAPELRALSHHVIDLGADLFWGHSNHTVQGIEIYHGRPILYACGDFVDDYAVDPLQRNDLSCLFHVHLRDARVTRIVLHPVRIAGFRASRATGDDVRWVHAWVRGRLAEFDTPFRVEDDQIAIDLAG